MPERQVKRQIFVALSLIINERGEILMGKRHDPKNFGMHGRWEFPGGKVEFGEHPEKTVVREAQEEVALTIAVDQILNIYSWFHPNRPHIQVVLMVYITHPTKSSEQAKPNCREVSEVAWKTIDEALKMNVIDNNKAILRDLKKAL
ncbi:MAG: NUDIX domain-containing protein [Candidatus Magasanikbacteria bacterium]|nr:NUDIX domain-containing protein [Candidatus Magasanikbacteria bacterium]